MKFAGDKTDVTALVKYAQDLEDENEGLRAALRECRKMVGHPDNIRFIDAALNQQSTKPEK